MVDLPKYKCHKEVQALKIKSLAYLPEGKCQIAPEEEGFDILLMDQDWTKKFKGGWEDFGYLVKYDDGYLSWSPTKAFEEGYTKIEGGSHGC